MNKPLIIIFILLLAGIVAANSNDCELVQINSTHWYFETTQTDLTYGTYNYQAFANNVSSDYMIVDVYDDVYDVCAWNNSSQSYVCWSTDPDFVVDPNEGFVVYANMSIIWDGGVP